LGQSGVFDLPSLKALDAFSAAFGQVLAPGDRLFLDGELGAGKTTFTRSVLTQLGVTQSVTSPTFTLVQAYSLPEFPVFHMDLYRLSYGVEVDLLDLSRYFDDKDAVIFVEWADRLESGLVTDYVRLQFGYGGSNESPEFRTVKWAVAGGGDQWLSFFMGGVVAQPRAQLGAFYESP